MTAARLAVTLLLTRAFSAVRWSSPSASSASSGSAADLSPSPPPVPISSAASGSGSGDRDDEVKRDASRCDLGFRRQVEGEVVERLLLCADFFPFLAGIRILAANINPPQVWARGVGGPTGHTVANGFVAPVLL